MLDSKLKYTKLTNCPHCGISLDGSIQNANHVRWCHKNPIIIEKSKPKSITCIKCKKQFFREPKSRHTTCSKTCTFNHSEESKIKLSQKQTEYLRNNKDKHVWKRKDKYISIPCENFKRYLNNNNIIFSEEYTPIESRSFSIDIAFPDEKIGIEINGNQHYQSYGILKPYYQIRHDLIESHGWKLIEVHYSLCFKESDMQKILINTKSSELDSNQ